MTLGKRAMRLALRKFKEKSVTWAEIRDALAEERENEIEED